VPDIYLRDSLERIPDLELSNLREFQVLLQSPFAFAVLSAIISLSKDVSIRIRRFATVWTTIWTSIVLCRVRK
jgi:hypothetical protein